MFEDYKLSRLFKEPPGVYPEKDPINPDIIKKLRPLVKLISLYFRPIFTGLENIPGQGPALLVGNHGIAGFDSVFLFFGVYEATGRMPRGLGDYHLFLDPVSRKFWTTMGAMSGNRENAVRFLRAGHLVNVYPGGAREAWKGPEDRYKLRWEKSLGFIKVAMESGSPIILHMGIGTDETYNVLLRMRWIGRMLGHKKYNIPILYGWGPLPRPGRVPYYFSKPIYLEGGPEEIEDDDLVRKNHQMVWEKGKRMLEQGLARRGSVWFG